MVSEMSRFFTMLKLLGWNNAIRSVWRIYRCRQGCVEIRIKDREYPVQCYNASSYTRLRYAITKLLELTVRYLIDEGDVNSIKRLFGLKSIEFRNKDVVVELNNLVLTAPVNELTNLLYAIRGIFYKKIYGSPIGRDVVDVGAWIGDTTIYFALNNRVVALEPHPLYYEYLIHNVALNNLQNKVVTYNKALDIVEIQTRFKLGGVCSRIDNNGDVIVETITLPKIIEKHKLKKIYLKLDCEGCEYKVIPQIIEEDLDVDDIVAELHGEKRNYLIKLIRKRYDVVKVTQQVNTTIVQAVKRT